MQKPTNITDLLEPMPMTFIRLGTASEPTAVLDEHQLLHWPRTDLSADQLTQLGEAITPIALLSLGSRSLEPIRMYQLLYRTCN